MSSTYGGKVAEEDEADGKADGKADEEDEVDASPAGGFSSCSSHCLKKLKYALAFETRSCLPQLFRDTHFPSVIPKRYGRFSSQQTTKVLFYLEHAFYTLPQELNRHFVSKAIGNGLEYQSRLFLN